MLTLLLTFGLTAFAQDEAPPEDAAPAEEAAPEEAAPAEEAPAEEAAPEEAPAEASEMDDKMAEAEAALEAAPALDAPTEEMTDDAPEEDAITHALSAELGFNYTTGNAEVLNAIGALKYELKADRNAFKAEFGANITYSREDTDGDGTVADSSDTDNPYSFQSQRITGTLRYDRFFSDEDALYVDLGALRDQPAGTEYRFDQGIGYHRTVVKTDATDFRFEVGAQFNEEDLVTAAGDPAADGTPTFINDASPDNIFLAARVFFGVTHAFNEIVSISNDLELIENLVSLDDPSASTPEDFRLYNTFGLSLKVTDILGVKISDQLAFDNLPASPEYSKIDNTVSVLLVATLL